MKKIILTIAILSIAHLNYGAFNARTANSFTQRINAAQTLEELKAISNSMKTTRGYSATGAREKSLNTLLNSKMTQLQQTKMPVSPPSVPARPPKVPSRDQKPPLPPKKQPEGKAVTVDVQNAINQVEQAYKNVQQAINNSDFNKEQLRMQLNKALQ